MLTVTTFGVAHSPQFPALAVANQAPPLPVVGLTVKLNAVPVLAMFSVCDNGFEPPNAFVKKSAFAWTKTAGPTVTLTGILTLLPADVKTNSPIKVPASNPCPGRLLATTPTVTSDVAVALAADT